MDELLPTPTYIEDLEAAAFESLRYFKHRDEMNAALHCGQVRYSPVTFMIARALRYSPHATDAEVGDVLKHDGAYELDGGR